MTRASMSGPSAACWAKQWCGWFLDTLASKSIVNNAKMKSSTYLVSREVTLLSTMEKLCSSLFAECTKNSCYSFARVNTSRGPSWILSRRFCTNPVRLLLWNSYGRNHSESCIMLGSLPLTRWKSGGTKYSHFFAAGTTTRAPVVSAISIQKEDQSDAANTSLEYWRIYGLDGCEAKQIKILIGPFSAPPIWLPSTDAERTDIF